MIKFIFVLFYFSFFNLCVCSILVLFLVLFNLDFYYFDFLFFVKAFAFFCGPFLFTCCCFFHFVSFCFLKWNWMKTTWPRVDIAAKSDLDWRGLTYPCAAAVRYTKKFKKLRFTYTASKAIITCYFSSTNMAPDFPCFHATIT